MHKAHANGFSQVDALLRGFAYLDWVADRDIRVLDFGCGSGSVVYEWRDRGYDAYGFDLIDLVSLRDPGDRRFFSYLEKPRENPSNTRLADGSMRTPYESASFDLIYSLAVVEHCFPLDAMMAECARLLKPGGLALHLFPSRNQLIETHFYVPFGGRIQSEAWFRLWARLGFRNAGQRSLTVEHVVDQNKDYCANGLIYRPDQDLIAITGRHFSHVRFAERQFYRDDRWQWVLERYWKALRSDDPLAGLAAAPQQRILIASGPKHGAVAQDAVPQRTAAE